MFTRPRTYSYAVSLSRFDVFPLDMLRFGECWPLTAADAATIEALIDRKDAVIEAMPGRVRVRLGTFLPTARGMSVAFDRVVARWESFTIRVEQPEIDLTPEIEHEEAVEAIQGIRRLLADDTISSPNFKRNVIDDCVRSLAGKLPGVSPVSVLSLCRSNEPAADIVDRWFSAAAQEYA